MKVEKWGWVCSFIQDQKPSPTSWQCSRQVARLQKGMISKFIKDSDRICNSRASRPEGHVWIRHGQLSSHQRGMTADDQFLKEPPQYLEPMEETLHHLL